MTLKVRPAVDDATVTAIAAVINATRPDEPTSLDHMRWEDATYPGSTRFVATLDATEVGAGTIGRIYMYPPSFDAHWATVDVLPAARRRGVGSALFEAVSGIARAAGKPFLHVPVSVARPEAFEFFLHRGFTEYDRTKTVRLELAGMTPPATEIPAGIVLTTLAERPDLVPGIHAVAEATFGDIPGGEPMVAGDLAEFRARDVDRPAIPRWGFVVALDERTGQVAGYASLVLLPDGSGVAWHDMTAVVRDWRGRGLATALKIATIGAAIGHGLTALETGNDEANLAMRAVNARLGYRPLPDQLTMRGPLARGIMAP